MNVLNKEYVEMEEQLQSLAQKWSKILEDKKLTNQQNVSSIHQFPVIPQLSLSIDPDLYHSFIQELLTLLKELQPALSEDITELERALTDEVLTQWIQEVISVNNYYFEQFATNHKIAEWIPFFTAEHAIRPFLRKSTVEIADTLQGAKAHGACPACGEPTRIAIINKQGKKMVTCPRCDYAWMEKKISCTHCGTDENGMIEILKVEGDESAEIHVCHHCKGYTKVVDSRKMIKEESAQLLDIKTIHLDYIAQENGFTIPEPKETH